jgi:hypothetical protein
MYEIGKAESRRLLPLPERFSALRTKVNFSWDEPSVCKLILFFLSWRFHIY